MNTNAENINTGSANSNTLQPVSNTLQHALTHCNTLKSAPTLPPPIKLRADSALSPLNPSQLHDLFQWIATQSYEEVLKRLSEQFGIITHQTTLSRFFHLYAGRLNAQQLAEILSAADAPSAPQLAEAAQHALLHRLFELAHTPQAHGRINELSRTLARHLQHQSREQEIQIARDRLKLQTRTFEFNAARQVLIHFHKVREILDDPTIDNQEKIERTRGLIFPPALPAQNP